MLKLIAIKKPDGYYIAKEDKNDRELDINKVYFNDNLGIKTFYPDWVYVEGEINSVKVKASQERINKRWELKNKELECEKIPLVVALEDIAYNSLTEEYDNGKYAHISDLYELKYDLAPEKLVEKEYELEVLFEIEDIGMFKGFSYPIKESYYSCNEKSVVYQVLDRILFPEILLPKRPCKFTSKQMFDIVRSHILKNIDRNIASITDYADCLRVEKKIKYTDEVEIEILNKKTTKYKSPKVKNDFTKVKLKEIFKITHNERPYDKYPIMPEMWGKNLEDLQNNVNKYLDELMEIINEPLEECPCCKGIGVINIKKVEVKDIDK